MTPGQEKILYDKRPDLWGVTRTMIHCRDHNKNCAKAVYRALTQEDRDILTELANDRLPEALSDSK